MALNLSKPSPDGGNETPQRHGFFHLLGTIILWCLGLFFLVCTIASFYSGSLLTSIFPLLITLLILPIRSIQTLFRSKLRIRSIKKFAVIVCLFFAWVYTFPVNSAQTPAKSPAEFQPVNESESLVSDTEPSEDAAELSDTSDAQVEPEEVSDESTPTEEETVAVETPSTAPTEVPEETPAEEPIVEEKPVVNETPAAAPAPAEKPAEQPVQSKPQSRTVYVTATGKRYHYNSNCGRGTYYASTLDNALARGLTPCKKCAGG